MKPCLAFIFFMLLVSCLLAQPVNPAPQPLPYSQDFSSLPHSSSTWPDGMTGWRTTQTPSTEYCINPPAYNKALTAYGYSDNPQATIYNYDGKIGLLDSNTGWCFAIVFALDTSGKHNIQIDYDIMTIRNPYSPPYDDHINEATLQYRIGTVGNFTTLTGIEYQNNTTQQINGTTVPQNLQHRSILLPTACENRQELQIRLVSRLVSGSGSYRPSFAIDNIYVTGEDISTLPVELSSFTASLTAENLVRLDWTTQSETGVLGFYIYRGLEPDPGAALLASPLIPATNTSIPCSYFFADAELHASGTYRYWLLSVDFNGAEAWHGPVTVAYNSDGLQSGPDVLQTTGLSSVFPNPFNPCASIDFFLETPALVAFRIFDARGSLVRELEPGLCPAGQQRVEWDSRDAAGSLCGSGTYHIRMDMGTRSFTVKAVLLK